MHGIFCKLLSLLLCLHLFSITPYIRAFSTSSEPSAAPVSACVTDYNAKGDGTTDDTAAIQSALNSNDKVYIPDGTYLINTDQPLRLNSNQTLTMSSGAILVALPSSRAWTSVICIDHVSNVDVTGGHIVGNRDEYPEDDESMCSGIQVVNRSYNVTINNLDVKNCHGDGVYVGSPTGKSDTTVKQITVDGVTSGNNWRQGLSITNAVQIKVKNCTFKNSNGTMPESGIDVEPNSGQIAKNISITNTNCLNNAGQGIVLSGYSETVSNISITGCSCLYNKSNGIYVYRAHDLAFSDTKLENNTHGFQIERDVSNVTLNNMEIDNNGVYGVAIIGSSQNHGIQNIKFSNCNIFDNSKTVKNVVGGTIIDNEDTTGFVKSISFYNCKFYDNQKVKTQRYGLLVGTGKKMSNIVLYSNCSFFGNIAGNYGGGKALIVK